jgi:Zn-finger nucleic acid-binding protein
MHTEHFLVEDFGLDRCLSCGSIWFDATELQRVEGCEHRARVLGSGGGAAVPKRITIATPKTLRCPRDGTPLVVQQHWDQPHVDLDACPTCHGVLLECGELTDLATHTWRERVRAWWRG